MSPGDYTRTYVNLEDADVPGFSVVSRRDGSIRQWWDEQRDGRSRTRSTRGPDLDPVWLMRDLTPEGRGTTWYPKLDYGRK